MRILFAVLSPISAELGAAQMALNLSQALRANGIEVVVWTPHPVPTEVRWWHRMAWVRKRIVEYVKADGNFDVVDVPPVAITRSLARQCSTIARSVQPDLLYLWAEVRYAGRIRSTNPAVRVASVLMNIYLGVLVLAGWSRARYILCLGSLDHEWMKRWFPWWRGKTGMYVNAIGDDERKTFAEIRRNRRAPPGPGRKFLWLGRWVAHKGNDRLLNFMERDLKVRSDDTITIAGCGPGAELEIPLEMRNSGRVRIVPSYNRRELSELLSAHDTGLFTSRVEGWGLTLQEMLESGMPVHATRAGAVCDLQDEFGGQLRSFPPPPSSKTMLSADIPKASYFERYSWAAIATRYIECVRAIESRDRKEVQRG